MAKFKKGDLVETVGIQPGVHTTGDVPWVRNGMIFEVRGIYEHSFVMNPIPYLVKTQGRELIWIREQLLRLVPPKHNPDCDHTSNWDVGPFNPYRQREKMARLATMYGAGEHTLKTLKEQKE